LHRGLITVENGGEASAEATMADVGWCWHHMGTTRMHESPRHGVVDPDGRVHGVGNLYVAGSSVFPTMGADHPTMTIVALALRMTDRILALLQDERSSPPAPAVAASL